jgi:3-dehydroquinate synthetase
MKTTVKELIEKLTALNSPNAIVQTSVGVRVTVNNDEEKNIIARFETCDVVQHHPSIVTLIIE